MKFHWLMVAAAVAAILVKENLCVPAISPLSQRGILFPVDNWDDCFLDEASIHRGLCKKLEECPEVLKKWDKENIYPKTCYFIKKQQFVCCPLAASIEKSDIFNTNNAIGGTTAKPDNIFLSAVTKRPTNIFLDNLKDSKTATTKRPSNIFLDNIKADKTSTTSTTTTKKPAFTIPDIFNTAKPSYVKRRSEIECDLQNQYKFEAMDMNGPSPESTEFPFMSVLGWKSSSVDKIWYPCGGVLVSSRFILTSAHCAEIGGVNPSFVQLGGRNLTDSVKDTIKIKQFIVHPSYNVTAIYNDIALVELEQEVSIPMACLWTQPNLPITNLSALGYGHTLFDGSSNQLFKAFLNAITKTECQEYYKLDDKLKTIDILDTHLCAGDEKNIHSSCQGDTGGPLLMELDNVFYVVGITSFGLGCADLPPSIYTRVSSFIDWIEPIIWPEIDVRFDRK